MVSSRDSYGLDNREIVIRIWIGVSFLQNVEAGSVAHPSATQWVIMGHDHRV
jgi:hypothetical protein